MFGLISTTHITTGAALGLAIGAAIPDSLLAVPIAFGIGVISHHVLDMIPHTDPGSYRKPGDLSPLNSRERIFAYADNALGTAIILAIFFTVEPSWPMLFGAAGGNFPDIFHHPNWWQAKTRAMFNGKYFHFHHKFHFTARGNLIPIGVLTNVALIIGSLWYILSQ